MAELIILAAPFSAIDDVLTAGVMAAVTGKVVVDVTNPRTPDGISLTLGCTTSGGEQIAAKLPTSHVVKVFNNLLAAGRSLMPDTSNRPSFCSSSLPTA